MNRPVKLWEILAAIITPITAIIIWLWNLGASVKEHDVRIDHVEQQHIETKQNQAEYRQDIKEMNDKMETILLKLENKKDL